jgi:hypothetical protein
MLQIFPLLDFLYRYTLCTFGIVNMIGIGGELAL